MLVYKGCEKTSAHGFAEVDELVASCLTKLGDSLGPFDYDLPIWIHAESLANVGEGITVWSEAVK